MIQDEISPHIGDVDHSANISDVLDLVESVTTSLGKDIERYSFKARDFENSRFMILTMIFGIYALTALLILQVTIDDGTGSIASWFGEPFFETHYRRNSANVIRFANIGQPNYEI